MSISDAVYMQVQAGVRYWEDATFNGQDDTDGCLIPCKADKWWCPTINILSGVINDWPAGVTASIHYKVCDDGQYWLLDASGESVAQHRSAYVPDMLAVGENGYGDYIIMDVDGDGRIKGWQMPGINPDEWEAAS